MAKATHNLSVAVGKYTNAQGEEKTRWANVGKVILKDDGGKFLVMNRTFNPAGVPNPDDTDSIFISIFPIEENQGQGQQQAAPKQPTQHEQDKANGYQPQNEMNDDIPFR